MIVEGAAVATELLAAIAQWMIDVVSVVIIASIRPWRYMLSPSYRASERAKLSGRSTLYRVLHFTWGSAALILAIGLIAVVVWAIVSPEPSPSARERVQEKVIEIIRDTATEQRRKAQ